MRKVIFIVGTGHCGSTLLDLILSSHGQAFGLGEISALKNEAFNAWNTENILPDPHVSQDTFWTDEVKSQLLQYIRPNVGYRKFLRKLLPKVDDRIEIELREKAYKYLFDETGQSILVDSSKTPRWVSLSTQGLLKSGLATPYVLYLSRDGRAVINAFQRKYAERGINVLTQEWMDTVKSINQFYEAYDGNKYWLKYEDLASYPEDTIRKVCNFIDIDFEPAMLRFWEHDHYHIGGNEGAKSFVSKFKYNRLNTQDEDKVKYYGDHELGIKLDERWKREITPEDLKFIEKNIHELNRPLRY